MGVAQANLDAPVIKGTTGIVVLRDVDCKQTEQYPCIRCGSCLDACPVFLNPQILGKLAMNGRDDGDGGAPHLGLHALRLLFLRLSVEHPPVPALRRVPHGDPQAEGFGMKPCPLAGHRLARTSVAPESTPRIMWSVVLSLVPICVAGIYFFGPSALLVLAAATARRGRDGAGVRQRGARPGDGSAVITGILLGLMLPAGIPLWMAFVGGAFGIGFGKLIFGGLGQNPFNPALLGRAFLQAAFPSSLTTWPANDPSTGTMVFSHFRFDAISEWAALRGDNFALPADEARRDGRDDGGDPARRVEVPGPGARVLSNLLLGSTGGCIGETAGILILLCGGYLALRGHLNWRIPAVDLRRRSPLFAGIGQPAPARHGRGPGLHALLRRPDDRCGLHGHRHGHLARHEQGMHRLRDRHRLPRGGHPRLGRAARGGAVRDPADERPRAVHQPRHAASALRDLTANPGVPS